MTEEAALLEACARDEAIIGTVRFLTEPRKRTCRVRIESDDGRRCDICSHLATELLLPPIGARYYTASGTRLDICNDCLAKINNGELLTDRWGFQWQSGPDGVPKSRHINQEDVNECPQW